MVKWKEMSLPQKVENLNERIEELHKLRVADAFANKGDLANLERRIDAKVRQLMTELQELRELIAADQVA
jgi:hypothetical protein